MEISTLTAGSGLALGRSWRLRTAAVIAALAIVLTLFVLVQPPAEASSTHASVAAAVVASDVSPQIDVRSIACGVLIPLRNAFANSPFFAFVAPFLNAVIAAFNCGVS